MKRYTWFLVFLLVLVPGWAEGATTYYISPTGDNTTGTGAIGAPWKTVKKGLAALSSGDTLILRGGTYSSADDIYESCTTAGVTIQAYAGETPIIQGPTDDGSPDTMYTPMLCIDADNATIDGLTITLSEGSGIDVQNCSGVTLKNLTVSYTYKNSINFTGTGGTHVLEDSECSHATRWRAYDPGVFIDGRPIGGGPMVLVGVPGTIVRRCLIHHGLHEGVDFVYNTCNGSILEDTTIYGCKQMHVYLSSSRNCIVRRNLIYAITDWAGDGIWVAGEDWAEATNGDNGHVIYDNMVANTESSALFIQGQSACSIDGLYVFNNTFVNSNPSTVSSTIRVHPNANGSTVVNLYFRNNIIVQSTGTICTENLPLSSFVEKGYNLWSQAITSVPSDLRGTGDVYSGNPNFTNAPVDWNDLGPGDLTFDNAVIGDGACVNAGVAPTTCTDADEDERTVGTTAFWIADDTVYDDDGYSATVDSIDSATTMTISGTDKAQITAAPDGLFFRQIAGAQIDIGAYECNQTPYNPPPDITAESCTAATTTITYSMTVSNLPAGEALTYSWKINGVEFSTTASGEYAATAYNNQNVTVVGYVYDTGSQSDATQTYNFYLGTPTSATYTFGENGTTTSTHFTGVTNDTNINGGATTTNYNANTYLIAQNYADTANDKKFLLSFDFSDLTAGQAAATISAAKLYLYYKDAGTDQTVALYTCSNAFVDSQATWAIYSTGNNWTGTHGQDDALGTFLVTSSDGAGHAYETALASTTDLKTAWANKGKFYIVGTLSDEGSAQFQGAAGTANYRPTLSVTVGEVPPTGDCKPSRVYSIPSSHTYKDDDVVPIYVEFTQDCGYLTVTGTPTVKLETGATKETAPYVSGTGNTTLRFDYTVSGEHNNTSLDLACHADFLVLGAATIKDSGNANPDSLALPAEANKLEALCDIVIDTEPPAAIDSNEVCDAAGDDVTENQTITADGEYARFAVHFPENMSFVGGAVGALPIEADWATTGYGTPTFTYASDQPEGWGIKYADIMYSLYVTDGMRGTVELPTAITPEGDVVFIDEGLNPLVSYDLAAFVYTWIIADTVDWSIESGGDAETLTAVHTALTYFLPDDIFTIGTITDDALDTSASSGTDGHPITFAGTSLTIGTTGLTVGDWSVVDIDEIVGNLTTGTNAVVSDLVIDGNLTAGETITRVMVK